MINLLEDFGLNYFKVPLRVIPVIAYIYKNISSICGELRQKGQNLMYFDAGLTKDFDIHVMETSTRKSTNFLPRNREC